jgi:branched-chain amino acid aminotransferase
MAIRINVNGVIGTETDRLISPLDHGFVFGASVYETVRTYHGRPFLLDRHIARLRRSAAALAIGVGPTDREFERNVLDTMAAADNPESYIRLVVSAGPGDLDYRVGASPRATTVIIVKPLPLVPDATYEKGIKISLVDVVRNHPQSVSPLIKASSLLNNILAMRQAHSRGGDEAVMLNHKGEVAEGAQTNVFVVREGLVATPALACGILEGITRELTLGLAAELEHEVAETTLFPDQLLTADEVFLTSTTREILPVVAIDDATVGSGSPGPVTLRLLQAYRARVKTLLSL